MWSRDAIVRVGMKSRHLYFIAPRAFVIQGLYPYSTFCHLHAFKTLLVEDLCGGQKNLYEITQRLARTEGHLAFFRGSKLDELLFQLLCFSHMFSHYYKSIYSPG